VTSHGFEPRTPFVSDDGPWTPQDLTRATAQGCFVVAVLVTAWYGASEQTTFREQLPWVSLSIGGLAALGFVAAGWLARGLRSVRLEQRDVKLRASRLLHPGATDDLTSGWVAARGMRMAHRPTCQLVQGKPLRAAPDGAYRCRICAP
jgi:hypothetical protein